MTRPLYMSLPRRKFVKLSELVGKRNRVKSFSRTQKKSKKASAGGVVAAPKRTSSVECPKVNKISKTEAQCQDFVPAIIDLSEHEKQLLESILNKSHHELFSSTLSSQTVRDLVLEKAVDAANILNIQKQKLTVSWLDNYILRCLQSRTAPAVQVCLPTCKKSRSSLNQTNSAAPKPSSFCDRDIEDVNISSEELVLSEIENVQQIEKPVRDLATLFSSSPTSSIKPPIRTQDNFHDNAALYATGATTSSSWNRYSSCSDESDVTTSSNKRSFHIGSDALARARDFEVFKKTYLRQIKDLNNKPAKINVKFYELKYFNDSDVFLLPEQLLTDTSDEFKLQTNLEASRITSSPNLISTDVFEELFQYYSRAGCRDVSDSKPIDYNDCDSGYRSREDSQDLDAACLQQAHDSYDVSEQVSSVCTALRETKSTDEENDLMTCNTTNYKQLHPDRKATNCETSVATSEKNFSTVATECRVDAPENLEPCLEGNLPISSDDFDFDLNYLEDYECGPLLHEAKSQLEFLFKP